MKEASGGEEGVESLRPAEVSINTHCPPYLYRHGDEGWSLNTTSAESALM